MLLFERLTAAVRSACLCVHFSFNQRTGFGETAVLVAGGDEIAEERVWLEGLGLELRVELAG